MTSVASTMVPYDSVLADMLQDLISSRALDLRDLADNAKPEEACGLLCHNGTLFPLINQARSPHRFVISPTLLGEAVETLVAHDSTPIGVYHSHPTKSCTPSPRDKMTLTESPGLVSIIIGTDAIAAWTCDAEGDVCLLAEVLHRG